MKQRASRPPLFEVRHSPIHGHGVFALRRIRKGTTVIEYTGDRITHEAADERYSDKDPSDNHTFLFTVDAKTVIDGGVAGNEARYINHGCDPNCESTTRNKRIYIETLRTIQPGEELAYDYQIDRDPDDPPDVDEIFACRCGAAKCRGSMLVAPRKPRKKTATGTVMSAKAAARKKNARGRAQTAAHAPSKRGAKRRPAKPRGTKRRAAAPRGTAMRRGTAR